MKGATGWIQRRKKQEDSGPMIIEETEEVDELITQSAAPTPSPRPSMPFCFSPQSGRLVETVPDSQEQPLPASQDVIESSFFSHASIPEGAICFLFLLSLQPCALFVNPKDPYRIGG